MKILQVIPTFGMGGAETMCQGLCMQLHRMGHEVTAVSLSGDHTPLTEGLEAAGVPVRYLDKALGSGFGCVGKLKTLMNIRKEPSLEAEVVTVYPMNTIVEVLEVCDNWLKIKCPEAEDGIAYVLNEDDAYIFVGRAVYEVVAGDNLWRIAERKLGSGTRYTDIRELNGLTSNAIRIGMKLLLP